MQIAIRAADGNHSQALKSLYRWLMRDAELAQCGRVSLDASGQAPGEMSAVTDVINAVFADAGAAESVNLIGAPLSGFY